MKKLIAVALLSLSFAFVGVGCTPDDGGKEKPGKTEKEKDAEKKKKEEEKKKAEEAKKVLEAQKVFVKSYSDIASAAYTDSYDLAVKMDEAIKAFTAAPTAEGLEACKKAWLAAREPYLQTEIYRFYDGPINNEDQFGKELEPLINAWPLDEGYIDYARASKGGAINEKWYKASIIGSDVSIDEATLVGMNEGDKNPHLQNAEANISVGYHAIEFILWGQDFNDDAPGDRPLDDFTTEKNKDRRLKYLKVVSELLVKHLKWIKEQWAPNADNYRKKFEAEPAESYVKALGALYSLSGSETGAERIDAAISQKTQEEEHSCFSDNTNRDFIQNIQGMINVYNGTYTNVAGTLVGKANTGLGSVIALKDGNTVAGEPIKGKVLAAQIEAKLKKSLATAKEMSKQTFESQIRDGGDNTIPIRLSTEVKDVAGDVGDALNIANAKITCPEGDTLSFCAQ